MSAPTLTITSKLAYHFRKNVIRRGQDYFWTGRVKILRGNDHELEATIRGTENYGVTLALNDATLAAWCDCPHFDGGDACKHLWAALVAAEARGFLSKVAAAPYVSLDLDAFITGDTDDELVARALSPQPPIVPKPPPVPKPPAWQTQVSEVSRQHLLAHHPTLAWPEQRQILYFVEGLGDSLANGLKMSLATRDLKADGTWSRQSPLLLKRAQIADLPIAEDREILTALAGGRQQFSWYMNDESMAQEFHVLHPLAGTLIPEAIRTGRCFLRLDRMSDSYLPLSWDEGGPWQFRLEIRRQKDDQETWEVAGVFHRGEEQLDVKTPTLVSRGGFLLILGLVAPLAADAHFEWISSLRKSGPIRAPENDGDELLAALLRSGNLRAVAVPEELRYEDAIVSPRVRLLFRSAADRTPREHLRADLSFDYGGKVIAAVTQESGIFDSESRRFLRRDVEAEAAAERLLTELGFKFKVPSYYEQEPAWLLAPSKLPRAVRQMVEADWHIEAEGKMFRRPGAFHMEVSSGVDWFELHGEVDYGGSTARLPALLEALRRGDTMVRLDDGAYGVVPEEFLRRIGMLAGMGTPQDGHIRFGRCQAGLLDALLATQPEASCDETFARMRDELRGFKGVDAAEQPAGFNGTLRQYQCEGLGWMHFLRRFSFGGCLADDMGVGKTAQVLALLETRRELRAAGEAVGPSLAVVPKSLIFNWVQEAARFTPQLRVLDYTGIARNENDFANYDLILTTYGTLRREIVRLKDMAFDYVVLDEAQAVKNANTEGSKAVRLLHGQHRLALSGTPVENHLGELWTLFEFLNPGMLGAASVFKQAGSAGRNPSEETRRLLAGGLRPFILRRTKQQVAPELPLKTEQTVYCEMEPPQQKLYNELRRHYREALLKRIETDGIAKSKIQVLEALLRLRQAACHPGLLDAKRLGDPSAKLDLLLYKLRETLDEGHKALVFSQFTSLLSIVRNRLDAEGVVYEYLDGATNKRQEHVERFQKDPGCRLFLISLKAGGLGLNLTAAEYVFLLDPWWNPAVEAQAVDRAHRIGQTQQVFAYRLITRGTVEEKVLELQKTKRDLAAAIISEDNSVIRDLRREDLELLLS